MRDTIFALVTAPGRAAVAIVRVSGPQAESMLLTLCEQPLRPRLAALRRITDLEGEPIDEALVLWFPQPHSFTGEDVFELQLHGGSAIIDAVAETLALLGARPAEPGEFSRRAFEAGRLELSQAEAIADLVDAETAAQRRQALQQLGGALARRGDRWRNALLDASAFLGVQGDFPDEDLPDDLLQKAMEPIAALKREIESALADHRGEQVKDGFKIALIGAPNAGKSSLLNALIGREAAIVTVIPGTTRDVIEAPLVIGGFKVLLADTAGLRPTSNEVEAEGIRRARVWAEVADLRLWLTGADDTMSLLDHDLMRPEDIFVITKSDLDEDIKAKRQPSDEFESVSTSIYTSNGLDELTRVLKSRVVKALSGSEFPAFTQTRHRLALAKAAEHLSAALAPRSADFELMAEDVRLAARALEMLSGRLDPEHVLDRVFGSFCIGK